ncbi:MAG: RluA family pseudouridine synthase [Christensenellaceae bacterium]|jgi:23S rRNA pseudouridine1911/1915/1917 synthase|nr:RluA family pseudouridine synthase [Christensenellaceae bacterium]
MKIKQNDKGRRLDLFLFEFFGGEHTRSQIAKHIKNGAITVNGARVKNGYELNIDDEVQIDIKREPLAAEPEEMPIDIVYEDADLMIINKPRGLVVHTGAGNKNGTLLNGLLALNSYKSGEVERAGIVHRLDKNTAGLMVIAKNAKTQSALSKMFEKHEVKRTYLGIVEGRIENDLTINKKITRDERHRTLFKVSETAGRVAITHIKPIEVFARHTLCEFNLETGRTHQIRVHLKSIGHPLVGDPEYNPNSSIKNLSGQMLEAVKLEFLHPITNEPTKIAIKTTAEFDKTFDIVSGRRT